MCIDAREAGRRWPFLSSWTTPSTVACMAVTGAAQRNRRGDLPGLRQAGGTVAAMDMDEDGALDIAFRSVWAAGPSPAT